MTKDSTAFGSVIVAVSDDDRDFLTEALGAFAMRYRGSGDEFAKRCERLSNALEAAPVVKTTSILGPDDRALVRRALMTHAFDTRGWDNEGDDERRAAIALDTRLCADELQHSLAQVADEEPPTQRNGNVATQLGL